MNRLIVIKGAGDIATGIAHRLYRCGFRVITTELPKPTVIRRTVAFAEAIYTGQVVVEEVTAVRATLAAAGQVAKEGKIPVVVDPEGAVIQELKPWAVVDAILAKHNTGTQITDAPVVVGIGPGFTAGVDVHAVESMRGHFLGWVIHSGQALANTGFPGEIGGYSKERVLRAPCAGIFQAERQISDLVTAGEIVARVNQQPVVAAISGVLRGLLKAGLTVEAGMKIGDIDPRCEPEHCFTISDKARSLGGGVLEALLYHAAREYKKKG